MRTKVPRKYDKGHPIANDRCPQCGCKVTVKLTVRNKAYFICNIKLGGCGFRAFYPRAASDRMIAEYEAQNSNIPEGENDERVHQKQQLIDAVKAVTTGTESGTTNPEPTYSEPRADNDNSTDTGNESNNSSTDDTRGKFWYDDL